MHFGEIICVFGIILVPLRKVSLMSECVYMLQ